jgi:putative nucleotidyltransferase-like protein
MKALSPEIQWAVACVRSLGRRKPPAPPPSLDWDRALAIAEAEGVAPALGFVFRAEAPAGMPAGVRERLHWHLTQSTARHLIFTRELGWLLEAFEGEQIPVILLKGPALAETLYPDAALRPCTDLDLLIRRESLVAADRLLQRLGYRRLADDHSWSFDVTYDRAALYEGPSRIHVDLHWGLLSDPRYSWDEREGLTVCDRAVPIRVAGQDALGLCPEDLLLYLAVHLAVHHGLAGLLWYWDLALILERWGGTLDWDALIVRASRWRVRAAFYFALLELEMLFGASAPAAAMAAIEPRGPRAAAVGWLLRHRGLQQRRALEYLIALLLVDRGRDLAETLRRVLLPPRAWLHARYEGVGSSALGHYLAHYRRLGQVVSQATQGLAGRVKGAGP